MFIRIRILSQVVGVALVGAVGLAAGWAQAQESVKIGLILPMTGGQSSLNVAVAFGIAVYHLRFGAKEEEGHGDHGEKTRRPEY